MTSFLRTWLWLLLALLAWTLVGFYAGDRLRNAAWLQLQAGQLQAATKQLQAEHDRGNALTTGLLTQQAHIDQLTQEAHHAITTATTGRTCLDSAALRVLNRAPGITLVPAPTSGTAATHGAPAAPADDSGDAYATDTQIASWSITAGAQYETCRARLDKLIDWHTAP